MPNKLKDYKHNEVMIITLSHLFKDIDAF